MKIKHSENAVPKKNIIIILGIFIVFAVAGILIITLFDSRVNRNSSDANMNIYFSEVSLSNDGYYMNEDGQLCDWIELYNASDSDADIGGFTISVSETGRSYPIPAQTTIKAHERMVFYCTSSRMSGRYTGFNLSKSGNQTLVLSTPQGINTDSVKTVATDEGSSYIRVSISPAEWEESASPTPGYENTADGRAEYTEALHTLSNRLVINELMAANVTGLEDGNGKLSDWLEVKNISDSDINLEGYSVSNDINRLYGWQFPNITLAPGECLLVYASGRDTNTSADALHTDFKLKKEGGSLYISDDSGHIISQLEYTEMADDQVYERLDDGSYAKTYSPTPGSNNDQADREAYAKKISERSPGPLLINEVMSKNKTGLMQNGGKHYDWIELINISDQPVDLSEYSLSNDPDDYEMWNLPQKTLQPGELIVFIASGEEILSNDEYTHTNFKINGDEIVILSKNGQFADGVCAAATERDMSYGRVEGKDGFFYFTSPTPGEKNTDSSIRSIAPEPIFASQPGIYEDTQPLKVMLQGSGKIYYTTDGTTPTEQSALYTEEGITVDKTMVVKAVSYTEGQYRSGVACASYIVNEGHKLPVISVSLDYEDMYGYTTGIYVLGPGGQGQEFPYPGANFWKDWEKEAQIDFFEDGGGFSEKCGIKIFGQYGRAEAKKSFQINFKDMYGCSELLYDVFAGTNGDIMGYKSLVLRSGSQDYKSAMLRDEFFTSLLASGSDSVYVQAYRPCVLYINGEYFGVYYIREKVNEDYVAQHLNVPPESATLLQANYTEVYGSNSEYRQLLDYVQNNDMTDPKHYQYVMQRIDALSLIDFTIGEIYSGNQDTGNVKFFKSSDPSSDGKWRWIYYDLDWAFYYDTRISFYLDPQGRPGFRYINTMISSLLKNDEFRDMFLQRFAYHLKNTFSVKNAQAVLDAIVEQIEPEMQRECERWNRTYSGWQNHVQTVRDKIETRVTLMLSQLSSEFGLTQEEYDSYFGDIV